MGGGRRVRAVSSLHGLLQWTKSFGGLKTTVTFKSLITIILVFEKLCSQKPVTIY